MFKPTRHTSRNASLSVVLALLLSFFSPSLGSWNVAQPANAASVDFSGNYLNFDASTMIVLNGVSTSAGVGNTFLYPSAGVIGGVSVDVTIQTIATSGTSNNFTWDAPTDGQFTGVTLNQRQQDLIILSMGNNGDPRDITMRFRFWETGSVVHTGAGAVSGIPVELRNLLINAYDLDVNQWVAFSGFQKFQVNNVVSVSSQIISNTSLVRFQGPSSGYEGVDSFTKGRVRVVYDQVSSVDIRIYAPSGALYGVQFGAGVAWSSAQTFNNSFNAAPTSTSTSKYVVAGVTSSLTIADFGNYADADSNPMSDVKIEASPDLAGLAIVSGSSVTNPAPGSTVSAQAIRDGQLRFMLPSGATAPATLSYRVGDGLTYSSVVYSMSLLVAAATQTITFPEDLVPKAPGLGAFSSSATATSNLPVTLTSNTPSVCTIHANGTDIVPSITSARSACSVTATQPGNSSFASAEPVTRVFYFSNQIITFARPADQVFSAGASTSSNAVANSTLPVSLTSLTTGVCTVSGLDIIAVAVGNCTIRAQQNGGVTGSPTPVTYMAAFPVIRTFAFTGTATFGVTYDANTGTGSTPPNVSGVTTTTIGTGSLSKPGFDFAGWNDDIAGQGTPFSTGSPVTLTANLELFAQWVANVTFDSQGGSSEAPQQYVFGQSALTLPTPTKAGSTFTGWSTTPNGAVLPGTYSSGSATLYAVWSSPSAPATAPAGGSVTYNGPEITSITPNVVQAGGGQLIQVVGRRLGLGDHVTIGGVRVPLVTWSTTGFSFVMPSLAVQSWDMLYTYDGGARLTYMNAITVIPVTIAPPASNDNATTSSGVVNPTPRPWSAIGVASKFAPGSPVINRAVRAEVDAMLRKYARFATTIECTGFTMGPTVLRVDAKLSSDRATNVCRLIKQLRPKLNVISVKGQQELRLGGEIRRVEVLFKR